ncbi:uncharacterized protein LOC126265564 [Aethina tumida]|uniref:uncharacterized protein LOC126265564 n=1 Tax=Aethina tumida TaxID=116153 RepID=UPI0021491C08|nr:uncharacterized protein LOC126265564 [Aethina tumida]
MLQLHLPFYQYCDPGTKLKKRLARGDTGINELDKACKRHDIAYEENKSLQDRHKANLVVENEAWNRVKSKNANLGEKAAAWLENVRGITIHHAGTCPEHIVGGGLKLDGFNEEQQQVFEFHGCYFHGCTSCFKFHRDTSIGGGKTDTMRNRYEATTIKTARLRNLGFEVIEMWECSFRTLLKQSCEVRDFVENYPVLKTSPLNPRDGFYGGRTGNTVTYYKCNEGERIKYIDVCSLYPFVCKYGRFPLGHPTIHVGSAAQDIDLSTVDGMVKCKILPPTQFCGESSQQRECCHTEEERSFTRTWVIAEVLKAMEEGYRIVEVFEVWTYETRQYNHAVGQLGLFTEMMNKFIKIKQEASGWPADCVNDVVKQQQYLVDFEEAEKVKLTPERIENNPDLRSLAKLMLNSFWGKCGQRENQPQTTIVNDPQECFDLLRIRRRMSTV